MSHFEFSFTMHNFNIMFFQSLIKVMVDDIVECLAAWQLTELKN